MELPALRVGSHSRAVEGIEELELVMDLPQVLFTGYKHLREALFDAPVIFGFVRHSDSVGTELLLEFIDMLSKASLNQGAVYAAFSKKPKGPECDGGGKREPYVLTQRKIDEDTRAQGGEEPVKSEKKHA
jgi:hypothetical protein